MEIGVEISLYPLAEGFAPAIHEFIGRLSAVEGLKIVSGSMSTQVFGEYERVFDVLRRELRATFESRKLASGKAVVVMKLLGPL